MLNRALLLPAVALVAWTFVVWAWMYVTRIPAIRAAAIRLDPQAPRGAQMALLPAEVRWKADNYNHLMEMPTLFYAIAIVLALVSTQPETDALLSWSYVGLRVIHSILQATWNNIEARFGIFFVSSLVLLAMTIRAALALV